MQAVLEDPRYPIGKYQAPADTSAESRAAWIDRIAGVPAAMRAAVAGLDDAQLDTPYRDGGWTLRQVLHHVPDSHLNAYTRFKLALTEENPRIKPYDEAGWARLADTQDTPIEVSLSMLEALHHRWGLVMRSMTEDQWARTFEHPDTGPWSLSLALSLYAWHGDHHVAHITHLRRHKGW